MKTAREKMSPGPAGFEWSTGLNVWKAGYLKYALSGICVSVPGQGRPLFAEFLWRGSEAGSQIVSGGGRGAGIFKRLFPLRRPGDYLGW